MFENKTGIEIVKFDYELIDDRIERIQKYMNYSRKLGELND